MKRLNHISKIQPDRNKAPSLQHWHIFSNVTTEITTPCSKKQERLNSNEVNSVSCMNFAHLWHCFASQSSQEFLPEPARKLLHSFTYFKEKIPLSTRIIYAYKLLYSSLFQSWLYALEEAFRKENNMSCSPEFIFSTAFLTKILTTPKLTCLHLLPLPQISCKPSKAEKKISNKISKANLVGLRFNSTTFPLECVTYSTQEFFNSREALIFIILRHVLLSR